MEGKKPGALIAALIFLAIGAAGLYRLLVGEPRMIAGVEIGQTASFFVFVIGVALALVMLRKARGLA